MFTTPVKRVPPRVLPHQYVFRGGSDYTTSEYFKRYGIAFFAEKISLASAYANPMSNVFYMYKLTEPYDNFLTEEDIMSDIQQIRGDSGPYVYDNRRKKWTRVSSSASDDYEFFKMIKDKYGKKGICTGGEIIIFDLDVIDGEGYVVDYYEWLNKEDHSGERLEVQVLRF